jgi:cysteinyl-tRNA synthetase
MLLIETKFLVNKHLRDNFNTLNVITELYTLGDKVYIYTKLSKEKCPLVLTNILNYMKNMLQVLGLTFDSEESNNVGANMLIQTHIELQSVIPNIPKEYRSSLFKIADKIRDKYLPALNVSVEN